jgi:hypothetical protein
VRELLLFAERSALGLLLLLLRPVPAVLLLVLVVLLLQRLWQPGVCGSCCGWQHMAGLQGLVLQS